MGGSNQQQQSQMYPMMKKETMQEFTNPDGSKSTYGGEKPYYGDAKPMIIPRNNNETLRNVEYLKAESAAPISKIEKSNKQHEADQLEQFSTMFSNQDAGVSSPNPTGRDTSVSEFMKAKTYNKPKGKILTAPTADYPNER